MARGIDYRNIINKNLNRTEIKEGVDLVVAELSLLLNFEKNSLFFGNNMGLDLTKYLTLTNKAATFNLIKAEIERVFNKYNRAILERVEMTFNDAELAVIINLTVRVDNQLINLPFEIRDI